MQQKRGKSIYRATSHYQDNEEIHRNNIHVENQGVLYVLFEKVQQSSPAVVMSARLKSNRQQKQGDYIRKRCL